MTENHEHREHGARHERGEHHEHHGVTEALAERPALTAILFDLRSVIGLLFVVYGVVLTILGIVGESPQDLAKSGGLALNLWTGLTMLVIGIIFYVWAFTKPPLPPEQDRVDHYTEGGPLHMGHDFAELHPDEVERRSRRGGHGHGH